MTRLNGLANAPGRRRGKGKYEEGERPEPDHRYEERRIAITQILGYRILASEDADGEEGKHIAAGLGAHHTKNSESLAT
ncbi:hypothetical protein D9M70_507190 [compost metagenome]